jgi:integrase
MSVRKRTWKTAKGEEKQAWIVDYIDGAGKRHIKSFDRKKDADSYSATARVEVREGIHTADSASITVGEAAKKWIETCEHGTTDQPPLERSTVEQYRQHVNLHIVPYLGRRRLSELTAPMIRDFGDRLRKGELLSPNASPAPRSAALTKKILTSLGSLLGDAQERGFVSRNVVRDLRKKRTRGKQRRAERRQRGKLKVGVDIPTPAEIKAIVGALQGRWRPILLTAIFAGLRASELRGCVGPTST